MIKTKKRISIVFLMLLLVFLIILFAKIDMKTYQDMTIDEMLKSKYKNYDCKYIQNGNYFLIVGKRENFGGLEPREFMEIVHLNDENGFEFFGFGAIPKMGKFKEIEINNFFGKLAILKNNNDYIMYAWEGFPQENLILFDIYGEWKTIENTFGHRYFFRVISEINDDYVIYVREKAQITQTIEALTIIESVN